MIKKFTLVALLLLPLAASSQSTFQQDLLGLMSRNEQHIVALAEAMPDDKFTWRPAEGVRSVSETMMHVATTNFYLMMSLGFELPAGVDLTTMETIVKKSDAIDVLKKSFAFVKENAPKIEDSALSEVVKLSFGEFSKRTILLILLDHSGEHKGQLIAYARMNNITPPWSM
jgi:uncharacterized damage-inducible protein DinB